MSLLSAQKKHVLSQLAEREQESVVYYTPKMGMGKTDFAYLDKVTDAQIEASMRDDPDWAQDMEIDWSKAVIVDPRKKTAVSIRLDADIIAFFKAQGKGYQTKINAVLRSFMEAKKTI